MNTKPDTPPAAVPLFPTSARLAIAAVLALVNVGLGFFMAVLAMTTNGLTDLQIYAIAGAGLLLTVGLPAYAIWSILSRRAHCGFALAGQILTLPVFVAIVLIIFEFKTTRT